MGNGQETRDERSNTAGVFAHHLSPVTRHFSSRHSSLVTASSGQAQVEFILSIVFLLVLIFGMFEITMLIYTYNVLADSAKEGVRYAIVHGADSSGPCPSSCSPTVTQQVTAYAKNSFHDISGMAVTVSYPDANSGTTPPDPGNDPPDRVRVVVNYPFKPLLNLGWPTVTVNAASEGRIAF